MSTLILTTPSVGPADPQGGWLMVGIYLFLIILFLSPQYVLNSLSLYRIASRRGIQHAWLSWVPLANNWVLGSISDQYQQVALGKTKSRRKILLLLNIAALVLYILALLMMVFCIISYPSLEELNPAGITAWGSLGLMGLANAAVEVTAGVFGWICIYDLFRSCDPKNAKVYLILSLVIRFVQPMLAIIREILQLVVSKKDLGMPEREAALEVHVE